MAQAFRYRVDINNLDARDLAAISAEEIMRMSMPEFLQFQNRLVSVRHRTRYDLAVWEKVIITQEMAKAIFRKGVGQEDNYASSDIRFTKTRAHTNMMRNGEFDQGSLAIITDISAKMSIYPSLPTTQDKGLITNCKATFPAYIDPALILGVWKEQTEVAYKEGDSEIFKGLVSEFPQNDGISGFVGANGGGVAQNVLMAQANLANPRVLHGGEDFSVDVRPLAAFDATAATGINQQVVQKIELKTIELVTVKV